MDVERVRVSDAEREAVVARLNAATSEGRLSLDEFGERAAEAYSAQTQGELVRLIEDLPVPVAPVPVQRSAAEPAVHHNAFGAVKRSGRWRIDRDTYVSTTFGTVKLDLTEAELVEAETRLVVRTALGTVKIWVPDGVRVEVEGNTFLGSRQVDEGPAQATRVLRLRVDTGIGTVKVYRHRPH